MFPEFEPCPEPGSKVALLDIVVRQTVPLLAELVVKDGCYGVPCTLGILGLHADRWMWPLVSLRRCVIGSCRRLSGSQS